MHHLIVEYFIEVNLKRKKIKRKQLLHGIAVFSKPVPLVPRYLLSSLISSIRIFLSCPSRHDATIPHTSPSNRWWITLNQSQSYDTRVYSIVANNVLFPALSSKPHHSSHALSPMSHIEDVELSTIRFLNAQLCSIGTHIPDKTYTNVFLLPETHYLTSTNFLS